jgi:hypothetical protein
METVTVFCPAGLSDNKDPLKQGKVFVAIGIAYESMEAAIEAVKYHFRDNCPGGKEGHPFNVYTSQDGNAIVEVLGNGPMHTIGLYKIVKGIS